MTENTATSPEGVHLRYITHRDVWRRLNLLEKIAVLQTGISVCSLGLLVLLVVVTLTG